MIGLYIFAGIIIFFLLLLQMSVGVRVIYNAQNLKIYAQLGFYKYHIVPQKPKRKYKLFKLFKRRTKKRVKKVVEKKFEEKRKKDEEQKYKLSEIAELLKDTGLVLLDKMRRYLKIKINKLNINVGAEDAYKTAKLYANINRLAYYAHEIIDNNFNLKYKNIKISSDFLSEKINFDIDIKVSMKLISGLSIAVSEAMVFVKFRAKNNIKNINEESENKWQTAT